MMPIVFAPLGEGLRVGVPRVCVEHTCVRAVAGDALALEIGDVLCERRGAEPLALVPNDPGFAAKYGPYYSDLQPYDNVLLIDDGNVDTPSGGLLIARVPVRDGPPTMAGKPTRGIRVWLFPPGRLRVDAVCPPPEPASLSGPPRDQLGVAPGSATGLVEYSQRLGDVVELCGWTTAGSVVVYADGHLVAAVRPRMPRPDIPAAPNSGFSVQLPLSALHHEHAKARVQLFGLDGRRASPLPFNCKGRAHDYGC